MLKRKHSTKMTELHLSFPKITRQFINDDDTDTDQLNFEKFDMALLDIKAASTEHGYSKFEGYLVRTVHEF